VLVLVAALAAGQAFTATTWQALLPAISGPEDLTRAAGLSQAATTVAGIAAPALAGVLTGAFGARIPLLIDTVTFLAITAAALLVRTRRGAAQPADSTWSGGFAFLWRDPLLRLLVLLLGLFITLGAMVNVVEVFLVRVSLHADALWYGVSAAGYACGVLVGALGAGRIPVGGQAARLVGAAAALAVGLIAIGLSPTVQVLLVAQFATGIANGVANVCAQTLVMGSAAPAERGRVGALVTGVLSAAELGAYVAGGALAAVLGPREIFVGAGVLGLAVPLLLGRALLRATGPVAAPGTEAVRRSSPAAAA
jgi:MFS family permease